MTYIEVKGKIEQLKQQVEAQGGLNSEQLQKLYHKFRLECNYFSNSSEGNSLTKEEIRGLITGVVNVSNKPLQDLIEIKNHDEVLNEMLGDGLVEAHLSEKYIKQLHMRLMYAEDVESKQMLGQWKVKDNTVKTYKGDVYSYVAADEVKAEMKELLNRTNEAIDYILKGKKYAPHPIDVALNFHVEFLKISPFEKGNGILARMLSNQILIAFVYTPFWVTDTEAKAYEQYLADVMCYEGAKDDLFGLVAQQIMRSQQMIVDIQEGKSIEESEKFYNQIELMKRKLKEKEEEKSKVKSEEWLESVFAHSIRPLFTQVESKVQESFTELFDEIKGSYTLKSASNGGAMGFLGGGGSSEKEVDLDGSITWKGAEYLQATFSLKAFKLIEEAQPIELTLTCTFEELTYIVDLGNGTVYTKEYDQQLEETVVKAIGDAICEAIVKAIHAM
ncbi:Fic family protein [Myroides pelagicus]|uniref:Fic family protein n=1 Tax=Myroides pelagicus TaxID=270914 RepID=UPI002DBDD9D2|nr:Fic family protein [Myroides pelagicus]MEC4114649.1 Fic family protein [Myroides pelagicus]